MKTLNQIKEELLVKEARVAYWEQHRNVPGFSKLENLDILEVSL